MDDKPPFKPENKKLYQKALNKWGMEFQLLMLMEECSELITATSKVFRYNNLEVIDRLAEEIADVEIMIEQIKYAIGLQEACRLHKEKKIYRLSKLLEERDE